MVFGFGEGKIDIILDKVNYKYGNTIKGKLKLELPGPTKAKELRVELITIKKSPHRIGAGKSTSSRFCTSRFSLGGENEYSSGEYDFELKIPSSSGIPDPEIGGIAGDAVKIAQMVGGSLMGWHVVWQVSATLDRPMAFDVTKQVQITVQ